MFSSDSTSPELVLVQIEAKLPFLLIQRLSEL